MHAKMNKISVEFAVIGMFKRDTYKLMELAIKIVQLISTLKPNLSKISNGVSV